MNEIMPCIYTFGYIPQMSAGSSLFDFFSTPYAIGMYLAILMFLVAVISGAVLIALHMMRKDAENIRSNAPYGEATAIGTEKTVADTSASRFSQLARIDEELSKSTAAVPYDTCELDELCEKFREYAAGKLGLYYDIADIRRFIAGMGISKLIILRGMSGTGKTSLAYAAGEFFGNSSTVVPIQPMWKERSDMIGYFNEFTKKFNETTMLCKLYEAGGKGDVYITVLDEVNISRIEYYFAEFLSLLELPEENMDAFSVDSFEQYRENFFATDHHWKNTGSYRGYREVLKLLGCDETPLQPRSERVLSDRFYGSYARGDLSCYNDKFKVYEFDFPAMECRVDGYESENYGNQEYYLAGNMPVEAYGKFYGLDNGEVFYSTNRPERENLLIIGDSYDNAIIRLLATHFNNTYSVDPRTYEVYLYKPFSLEYYIEICEADKVLFLGNFDTLTDQRFYLGE